MPPVKITPTDNGPYVIEGPARVVDANGNEYDLSGEATTTRGNGTAADEHLSGRRLG
jgi:hypothetical protein